MKNTSDIESILEIWLEENIKAHYFIDSSYWKENIDLVKNHYLPNSKTFCCKENEKIIGFISIINKEYVGAIFISSKYQRKGFGSYLIRKIKENYPKLRLAVYKKNKNAISFYKNHDFKIISEQLNDDTKEKEYIMGMGKNISFHHIDS